MQIETSKANAMGAVAVAPSPTIARGVGAETASGADNDAAVVSRDLPSHDAAAVAREFPSPATETDVSTSVSETSSTKAPPVNFATFIRGFKVGDAVHVDGPGPMNGSGKITQLDADHFAMSYDVTMASGSAFNLTRNSDGLYSLTAAGTTMKFKQSMDGNDVVFTKTDDPDKRLVFSMSDGDLNIEPFGFHLSSSFDITHK